MNFINRWHKQLRLDDWRVEGIFLESRHCRSVFYLLPGASILRSVGSQVLIYHWSGTLYVVDPQPIQSKFRHHVQQHKLCKTANWTSTNSCINDSFIPRHTKSGGVLCYTLQTFWVSLCLSVSASFPDSNSSSFWPIFFKLCMDIDIGEKWFGIANGLNSCINNRVMALDWCKNVVSGL